MKSRAARVFLLVLLLSGAFLMRFLGTDTAGEMVCRELKKRVGEGVSGASLMIEYGAMLKTMRKMMRSLASSGEISEISINTDRILTIVRMLNADYFVVLALRPEGNYGRGRYALRIAGPELRRQIE